MNRLFTSLLSAALLCATGAQAQSISKKSAGSTAKNSNPVNALWQAIPIEQAPSKQLLAMRPGRYRVYQLNETPFRFQMFNLSFEATEGEVISLPMADGSFRDFKVWQTPMMDNEMASKYPDIRTFTAYAVSDQRITAKLDFTLFGFHAVIFEQGNTSFIDPYDRLNDGYYIVHYKKDEVRSFNERMRCEVAGDAPVIGKQKMDLPQNQLPKLDLKKGSFPPTATEAKTKSADYHDVAFAPTTNGSSIRTYRIAVSANNFYCQAATGLTTPTIAQCLSTMTTTMNRVNGVYNREFSVQMNFCTNEDQIIWPTATGSTNGTDPFNSINSNASACISQNQTTCDTRIGNSNYDIGHIFTTGAGGLAMLGVVCNNSFKAQGVTGSPMPVGDGYDIDYVAHEVGHEFGSNHTFNNNGDGSCTGNASSANAYEPASGATIMDYAGICSPDNIQPHSDPYFSGSSVVQISNLLATSENVCAAITATSNVPATLATFTQSYNIPYKTPFELTGPTAVPGAADTAITYGWFQWNLGDFGMRLNQTFVYGPIFRSYQPVYTPTRIFPRIDSVLKGNLSNAGVNNAEGEKAPDTTRYLTFRMAARAIMAGYGAIRIPDDSIHLNAYSTGAANGYAGFKVTSQGTTGIVYTGGTSQTITWNVVGTNNPPVSASNVDIYMSTDGGYTWPYTIGTFPNTGSATVTLPNPGTSTTTARIKVKGNGNVFFNINGKNFAVNPGPTTLPITGTFTVCVGSTTTLADATPSGTWTSSNGAIAPIGLTSGVVSGASAGTATITYNAGTGNVIAVVTVNAPPTAGSITGTASVCIGSVTTLAHIVSGGVWLSANPSVATVNTSGEVTGVGAGTALISYTITNGCGSATATRVVTVNAPTSVSPITGTLSVCVGASTTLADITSSGTWSSASTSIATIGATTGIVSGAAAGTAIISYIVTNGFGCVSNATAIVTVSALPSATTIPSGLVSICTGATATLSATTGTGMTYQWQLAGADITGATNSTFATTVAGNYTARITNSIGCTATSPVVTVNVSPGLAVVPFVTLAASPGNVLCSSASTVTFTPAPVNGGTTPVYNWYVNGVLAGSGAPYAYTPANGDVVTVIMTSNAPCATPDTASSAVTMTISPLATPAVSISAAPNDTVCAGNMVTFSPLPVFGGGSPAYTWTRNGTVVSSGLYYSYAPPLGQDTIMVSMISNYTCLATSAAISTPFIVTATPSLVNTLSITASATTITPGQTVTFISSAGYTGTYQWYINGTAVSGATSTSFVTNSLTNGQVVTCRVISGNACVSPNPILSNAITIQVKATGLTDLTNAGNYAVIPNPNKGTFVITGTPAAANEEVNITIVNMLGQTVYNQKAHAANGMIEEHVTLESSMANGMYLVKVTSGNDNAVFRITVDR
jgi:hypothetical protein